MVLTTRGGTAESFCLITHPDDMPLIEAKIFRGITWMGIFLALNLLGVSFVQRISPKYIAYKNDRSKVRMVKYEQG